VRTMSGDVSSLNSSGGEAQQPKTFRPKDLIGGEPVFKPKDAVPVPTPAEAKAKHVKVLMAAVIGAVLAIGLAVAGFIFVPKLIQKPVPPAVAEPTAVLSANPASVERGKSTVLSWQTTNATDVSIDGIGAVELNGSKEVFPAETITYHLIAKGVGGTKEVVFEVIVAAPVAPPFRHQSMFPQPSNVASVSVVVSVPSPAGYNGAVKAAVAAEAALPIFKEVNPTGPTSAAMDAYSFFPFFIPGLTGEYLTATINQDFTAFVYKDKNGVWPGYAVKLMKTVSSPAPDAAGNLMPGAAVTADATELINAIKALPTVFYVDDPGAAKATKFKDGAKFNPKIQSIQYLAYTKAGASFNVATLKSGDDTFVIWSTSFNGIKEAIRLLGF